MATSDNLSPASTHGPQLHPHQIFQHEASPSQRQPSGSCKASSAKQAVKGQGNSVDRPKAYSSSSRDTHSSTSTRVESRAAQRGVRTLPPWIDSYEGEEIITLDPTDRLLSSPSRAHAPQHQSAPSIPPRRMSQDGFVDTYDDVSGVPEKNPETGFFGGHKGPVRGRKWDHAREGDPVIMQSLPTSSPWRTYIKSSMYGPALEEDGERVDPEFLQQQTPGYQKPWVGDLDDPEKIAGLLHNRMKQRTMMQWIQHNLLMHPLVPMIFRVTVLITSLVALGLSTSVHHLSNKYNNPQNPSTTMAIVVDVVAIPYILYITWDEYTGAPLGLRSPKAKIRLVLLDLFFVIFESANLALAFAALTDTNGSCRKENNGSNFVICGRVKGLCGILMVALVAWTLTFNVSIFRLVERVGGREESDYT